LRAESRAAGQTWDGTVVGQARTESRPFAAPGRCSHGQERDPRILTGDSFRHARLVTELVTGRVLRSAYQGIALSPQEVNDGREYLSCLKKRARVKPTTGPNERARVMDCPACGSSQVQKTSMAYESGVTRTSTTSRSGPQSILGSSYGPGGVTISSGTLSGSTTDTKQVSITDFAKRAAPPEKLGWGCLPVGCLTLLVSTGLGFYAGVKSNNPQAGGGLVLAAVCVGFLVFVFLAIRAFRYNRTVFPRLRDSWNRSWICAACGNIFTPASLTPS
jgi:hypothetical protein